MFIIDQNTTPKEIFKLLLKNRHLNKESDIKEFLNPKIVNKLTAKDFSLNQKQIDKAVKRINLAIKNQENILIYGDYDVDGITSTAILWNNLNQQGAKILPFVPDRHRDGYGFKADSFFDFEKKNNLNFDLLITVDNGILAHKEFKKVLKKNKNIDIIVVDHHLAAEKLPKEIITLHSTISSGAGLAWFLAREINKNKTDLSLATLGVVADCLPLQGVNRNLVYHGLKTFNSSSNPGLKKLIDISSLKKDSISSTDLAFILAPRINAAGRLSDPTDALRLLCSNTSQQASKFAKILDDHNRQRQNLQQKSINLAKKKIDSNFTDKVFFIADKTFHPGIIGLIAGRLTEEYNLPSIIISIDDGIAKGSCRSIEGLNIVDALKEISHLFLDLGGHPAAAGFTLETKNIPSFQKKITKIINKKLANKDLKKKTFVEAQMKLSAVTVKNCQLVDKLEPFGIANPEPIFLFKNVKIISKKLLGSKQDHLKLKVIDSDSSYNSPPVDLLAFRQGHLDKKLNSGDLITFTARLNLNVWNGYTTPQLFLKEFLFEDK